MSGFAVIGALSLAATLASGGMMIGCGSGDTGNGDDGGSDSSADGSKDSGIKQDSSTQDSGTSDTGTQDTGVADTGSNDTGSTEGGGNPVAVFVTTPIDLGAGGCGVTAGVTQTFSIKNTGNGPLTVTDSVSGTVFSASPATLSVAAGATSTITVTAVVPQASTAGAKLSGTLSITTNDPAHATASIPLSVTPTGATLAWAASSPTSANFGVQAQGVAATPIALTLSNTGNATAAVAFGTPTDPQFSLTPTTGSLTAGGTQGLSAGFTPNTTTASMGTSAFTVTGAVCGTSVSSLAFAGQGGTGSVNGWPTGGIDFGGNACGGAAAAGQTFTLTNSGTVAAHIATVTFSGFVGYASSAAAGATIPASGSLVVTLTAPPVPFPSAVPGNYAGTVTYTTDVAGDTPHQVNVTEHALGAILAFDTSATPGFGNFGNVPVGSTATENFAVVNSGNAASSVTLAVNAPFGVSTSVFNVTGGANQTDTASFTPTTFGAQASQLVASATNLCQPVPKALSLSGTGESGGVAITGTPAPFTVNCGATAAPQAFKITNSGNQPMTWSAVLSSTGTVSGTWYSIAPANATLAAGASSTVTVTPTAMPARPANPTNLAQFKDTVVVTTNIIGDTPHNVAVSETPLGDILTYNSSKLVFGPTPITVAETAPFTITNGANPGSAQANVTIASKGANAADFTVAPTTAAINAGQTSGDVNVTFKSATAGVYKADLGIATTDVLCADLPADLTPSAQATEAGPVCNSTGGGPCSLTFGNTNCGATASAAQLVMTNTGTQAYSVTALTLKTNTYYTVAMVPATGVVNPGGSLTITVTPKPIPTTVPKVPDQATYSDTLTIATNANSPSPNFTAPLTMGAAGVIIDNNLPLTNWAFGTVNYGSTGTFNVQIHNAGNEDVQVALSGLQSPTIFGLQSNPTVENVAPGTTTVTGTFTPPSGSGTWADQGSLTVTPISGAVLCQPLPASWVSPTITFTGSASNNPILTVSGSLTFPNATCGAAFPAAQNVTIFNNSSNPVPFTATLQSTGTSTGNDYVASPASGTVPAGGQTLVTVTPGNQFSTFGAGVLPGAYDDSLVINASGSSTFNVPINMTLNGMVLQFPNAGPFYTNYFYDNNTGLCGTSTDGPNYNDSAFSVQNTGNLAGDLTPVFVANDWVLTSTSGSVQPNATFSTSIRYSGSQNGCGGTSESGTLSFSNPALCQPSPTATVYGYQDTRNNGTGSCGGWGGNSCCYLGCQ